MSKIMSDGAYVAALGMRCPVCDSRNVEAWDQVYAKDDATAIQEIMCIDCKAEWEDIYILSGFNLTSGE